jgi:hypothetical protein
MEIFELSKGFPKEEKYALTDQMRRSSRSVCANYDSILGRLVRVINDSPPWLLTKGRKSERT